MTTLVSERSPITTPKLRDRVAAPRVTPRAPASPQAAPRPNLIFRFIATLLEWHHRRVVRRELGTLDPRMLRDVGLDANTVDYELRQWFWRPTRNWRD